MYKLMIVDDERLIVEGLAEMIEESDLPVKQIQTAGSALEALELHREQLFDLILTDIRMPRMDGLELFDKVKSIADDCKVIFLSGYSDFEYARTALKLGAFDYLLKPVEDEEVISCLEKAIAQLKQERTRIQSSDQIEKRLNESLPYAQGEFLRHLLHRKPEVQYGALDKEFGELGIPFRSDRRVTGFAMSLDVEESALTFMDEVLLQFVLQNMINELLGGTCHLICFTAGKGIVACIMQAKEMAEPADVFATLLTRLQEVQEIIGKAFKSVCSFALMNEWLDWSEWPEACNRLISGMKLQIEQGQIFVPSLQTQQTGQTVEGDGVPPEMIRLVMEAINLKDVPAFAASLDQLLEKVERAGSIPGNELTVLFLSISSQLVHAAQHHRVTYVIDQESMDKMSNLSMHPNLTRLKDFLVGVLQEVVSEIQSQQRNPTEQVVEQVKHYIAIHVYENLSLDQLADKVHVNASYLSRIFRQYTREKLTSYVTRIKMEHARKLLLESDIRVQDVATKLGFDNANYFAKVFRKANGLSPHEFRLHHSRIR